jgi:hypothetical protein
MTFCKVGYFIKHNTQKFSWKCQAFFIGLSLYCFSSQFNDGFSDSEKAEPRSVSTTRGTTNRNHLRATVTRSRRTGRAETPASAAPPPTTRAGRAESAPPPRQDSMIHRSSQKTQARPKTSVRPADRKLALPSAFKTATKILKRSVFAQHARLEFISRFPVLRSCPAES